MKARLPQEYNSKGSANIRSLAQQAQKIQEEIDIVTEELEQKEYSTASGGGAVEVVINGKLEVKSIKINPEIVDKDDIEMLSDMIIAAVNESIRLAVDEKDRVVDNISNGLNLPGVF